MGVCPARIQQLTLYPRARGRPTLGRDGRRTVGVTGPQARRTRNPRLNVLIIGPNRSFLQSVAAWVNRTGLVERVHTATDAKEGLRLTGIVAPEVIVLDAGLPNSDWRQLSVELKARSPASRVLLLSGASPAELVGQRRSAEVDGYLSRNDFARRFRRLLRTYAEH